MPERPDPTPKGALPIWALAVGFSQRLREYREANYLGGNYALRKVVPNAGGGRDDDAR